MILRIKHVSLTSCAVLVPTPKKIHFGDNQGNPVWYDQEPALVPKVSTPGHPNAKPYRHKNVWVSLDDEGCVCVTEETWNLMRDTISGNQWLVVGVVDRGPNQTTGPGAGKNRPTYLLEEEAVRQIAPSGSSHTYESKPIYVRM